jgi:hypothetical protein
VDAVRDLDAFHIESHASLVQQPAAAETSHRSLDAIVVPTIRPHLLLELADFASELGCALVVLCSTPSEAGRAMSVCWRTRGHVTYVQPPFAHRLLSFRSAMHPELDVEPTCHSDIASKRNVGLLLARLCGWRTMMYLDDDISGLTVSAIAAAANLTERYQAVGFKIGYYPDNSVVCHAHRLAGGKQDVFPGGSALVVDVTRADTLFPPIYNEDWLFLFDAVRDSSVAVMGTLSQLEYQPFANSRRAASEEFGDLIAEGLYRLIHQGAELTDASYGYWKEALERRSRLIDDIAERLLRTDGDSIKIGCALMSLAAARKRLTGITPLACVSFVRAWRMDLDAWRQKLLELPRVDTPREAMRFLGLPAPDECVVG